MQPPVGERVNERKTDAEGGTVTVGRPFVHTCCCAVVVLSLNLRSS